MNKIILVFAAILIISCSPESNKDCDCGTVVRLNVVVNDHYLERINDCSGDPEIFLVPLEPMD